MWRIIEMSKYKANTVNNEEIVIKQFLISCNQKK